MKRTRPLTALLIAGSLAVAACGSDDGDDAEAASGNPGSSESSGSIVISGSSTVEPISGRVAELFRSASTGTEIQVDGPGTGDGFQLFCAGETDISDASRPIEDEEIESCEAAGVDYVELMVAYDGLSVLTSPDNDVECLTFADLYALAGPESTGFSTWSDAEGLAADVGAEGGYPDLELVITGPGEESGTYDSFVEIVLEDIAEQRGQEAETRPDYTSSPNDNVIIEGVAGSTGSLGWVGFAFAEEAGDAVKELEVDGGDGCVTPTIETIADGSYPISRPLFIYVNTARAAENQALADFVDLYLSDEGVAAVEAAGYVPLPDDEMDETRSAWTSR